MSNLIALGHADVKYGTAEPENVLTHAFFTDDGGIEITVESPDGEASNDTIINIPASAVEAAMRKRIQGRGR
jgi:hypothetical protein